MNLKGKVALVTGGAVRVGRAITLGLAKAGAHVGVHYHRSQGPAQETVAQARQMGVKAWPLPADLADPAAPRVLAQRAQEQFGQVDLLIHGASLFARGSLHDTPLETWQRVMNVLVQSFFLLSQELAPGMMERGEGAMIAILDRGVVNPWPDFLAHGVGKSGLWALARSLAVELAPKVRVNGVVPGPVLPPPGYAQADQDRIADGTLLKRWGTPQDVVEAVLFLLRSDYITGEMLFVDGGERWV